MHTLRKSWRLAARFSALAALFLALALPASAQELEARVTVNHQQVQGSSTSVFEALETQVTAFLNDRHWTSLQFQRNERIACTFNLTISKYTESENTMEGKLTVQCQRPAFGSSYTSTVFAMQDDNFAFTFSEFDQLEFRPDVIDNDLTATLAFYAYLIIGMDLDAMSPLGGTEVLEMANTVVNNAQSLTLSQKGWKAFESSRNRYAIITDYLDTRLEPFRQLQYKYHREGMDTMAENAERARASITEALELLKEAHTNKPLSLLPQIFTEYKRDELVGIYQGRGTSADKETIYETLSAINASQNTYWTKLRQ